MCEGRTGRGVDGTDAVQTIRMRDMEVEKETVAGVCAARRDCQEGDYCREKIWTEGRMQMKNHIFVISHDQATHWE